MATMLSAISPTTDVITAAAARRAVGSERQFGATDVAGNTFTGPPSSLFLPVEGTTTPDGGLATDAFSSFSTLAFAQTRAEPAATGLLAEGLVEDTAVDINQLSLPFGDAGGAGDVGGIGDAGTLSAETQGLLGTVNAEPERTDPADPNTALGEAGASTEAGAPPSPGSAAAQAAEADALAYYDPLDTNRDGLVSEMERFMASLQDPATAANDAWAFPAVTDAGVIANPATAQANALYANLAAQPLGPEEPGRSLDVTA